MDIDRTPRRTLIAGVTVTGAATVLLVAAARIVPQIVFFNQPSGQALFRVVDTALDGLRLVALPLGVALIGAGLVMVFLRRWAAPAGPSCRPRGRPSLPAKRMGRRFPRSRPH